MTPVVHKWIGNSPLDGWKLVFEPYKSHHIQVMDVWSLPGAQLKTTKSFTLARSLRLIVGHGSTEVLVTGSPQIWPLFIQACITWRFCCTKHEIRVKPKLCMLQMVRQKLAYLTQMLRQLFWPSGIKLADKQTWCTSFPQYFGVTSYLDSMGWNTSKMVFQSLFGSAKFSTRLNMNKGTTWVGHGSTLEAWVPMVGTCVLSAVQSFIASRPCCAKYTK